MKKSLLAICLMLISSLGVMSKNLDEKYVKAMETAIGQLHTSKSIEDYQAAANKFEMIGKNAKDEWLPAYYEAYCYSTMSFIEKDGKKRDIFVDKSEAILKGIKVENEEILIMKAFNATASLSIDGKNRWMVQGPIFDANLIAAEKLNPENPRIYHLRANNLFYTPEAFGGGAKVACPLYQKAKEKFETFNPESSISPNWGKEYNEMMLKNCK